MRSERGREREKKRDTLALNQMKNTPRKQDVHKNKINSAKSVSRHSFSD